MYDESRRACWLRVPHRKSPMLALDAEEKRVKRDVVYASLWVIMLVGQGIQLHDFLSACDPQVVN